jgi:hypothetical protein
VAKGQRDPVLIDRPSEPFHRVRNSRIALIQDNFPNRYLRNFHSAPKLGERGYCPEDR